MSQVFPFHFYSVYKGFYNQLNISQLSQKKKKEKENNIHQIDGYLKIS